MPSLDTDDTVVRFGVFELDVRARQLRKRGRRVHLQDKPFETLLLLLDRCGALVTREELRQHLWPADTFVIFLGRHSPAQQTHYTPAPRKKQPDP